MRPSIDPMPHRREIEAFYDRTRDQLPFATTSLTLRTRFGETHLLQAGPEDGPPVVVFQGGNVVNPLTLAWFAPLVDRFRIHAPDTIGQPGKSSGLRVSANNTSLGEWAVDVLDGLALPSAPRRWHLVWRRARPAPRRPRARADRSRRAGRPGRHRGRAPRIDAVVGRRLSRLSRHPARRIRRIRRCAACRAATRTRFSSSRPRSPSATPRSIRRCRATRRPMSYAASARRSSSSPASTTPSSGRTGSCPGATAIFPNSVGAETLPGCAHILGAGCADKLAAQIRAVPQRDRLAPGQASTGAG